MSGPTMNADVLSQIFETTIDTGLSSLSILRSVNRQWFETLQNLPKFWSRIKLFRKIHFIDPAYVCLHIQNSGRLPLDIDINLPEDFSHNNNMPSISQLRKVAYKIKSLTIDVPVFEAWEKLVSGIGEGQPAPLLEQLVLKVYLEAESKGWEFRETASTTLSTALTPSPKLVHLQLPAIPILIHPPPHLASITSLTFDTLGDLIKQSHLFEHIRAAPKLQHFTFNHSTYYEWCRMLGKISAPQLRSVSVSTPGYGIEIMEHLFAPLLTDVRMDGSRDGRDTVYDEANHEYDGMGLPVFVHLSANSPNIRRLNLISIYCYQTEDFKYILSSDTFPVLEELILRRVSITDASLIESAAGRSNLRKLELYDCRHISIDGLWAFVQGRCAPGFVLLVKDCPGISEEDINSLSN